MAGQLFSHLQSPALGHFHRARTGHGTCRPEGVDGPTQRPDRRADCDDLAAAGESRHARPLALPHLPQRDVSQLPVLNKEGGVEGILDEEDILFSVVRDEDKFKEPVRAAMTYRLQTLDASEPVESLLPIFAKGHVAIVTTGDRFEGLITRIDLLNYLRRQMS